MPKFDREKLTFNPNNHGHYYDGVRLLGVTTALSAISKGDGITQWAVNCACDYARTNLLQPDSLCDDGLQYIIDGDSEDLNTILYGAKYAWKARRDEAAAIGTIAHNWIESYLKGDDPEWPEDPHARRSCEGALEWIKSVKWKTHLIEHQIYIPELGVGGICDWYAEIDGVLAVPDWKTSKSLYTPYAYQTAAYLKALEGEFDIKIPHRWLIRIDKETGEFEPRFLPEESIEADYKAFESAVTLFRREQELKKEWNGRT